MVATSTDNFELIKDLVKGDERGRLVLGEIAKNQQFRVERNGLGEVRLIPLITIPAREGWLFKNQKAIKSLTRGLEQAKSGKVTRRGPNLSSSNSLIDELEDAK